MAIFIVLRIEKTNAATTTSRLHRGPFNMAKIRSMALSWFLKLQLILWLKHKEPIVAQQLLVVSKAIVSLDL
jgi:hypothetical protein